MCVTRLRWWPSKGKGTSTPHSGCIHSGSLGECLPPGRLLSTTFPTLIHLTIATFPEKTLTLFQDEKTRWREIKRSMLGSCCITQGAQCSDNLEGWDGVGGRFMGEETYVYPWLIQVVYGKSQHNIISNYFQIKNELKKIKKKHPTSQLEVTAPEPVLLTTTLHVKLCMWFYFECDLTTALISHTKQFSHLNCTISMYIGDICVCVCVYFFLVCMHLWILGWCLSV